MNTDRLQIAVWLLTPVFGLVLLGLVIGARGGVFMFPLLILLILMFIVPVWYYQLRNPG